MNIKIYDRKGIRLETEGTYCEENIDIEVDESLFNGTVIFIPSVKNLYCDKNYILTWTKPDISNLSSYNPTMSYIVKINGTEKSTSNTTFTLVPYLNEGYNEINVVVKVVLTSYDEGEYKEVKYSLPSTHIVKLEATIPNEVNSNTAIKDGVIYMAYEPQSHLNKLLAFDIETEIFTQVLQPAYYGWSTIAIVGDYLYSLSSSHFQYYNAKLNLITGEISTTTLGGPGFTNAITIGTNIYGVDYNRNFGVFDTLTETTTLIFSNIQSSTESHIMHIGNDIYLLGGNYTSSSSVNINVEKINITDGTCTSLNKLTFSVHTPCYGFIDNDIFLIGGFLGKTSYSYCTDGIFKYNIVNQTTTRLPMNLPMVMCPYTGVQIGNDFYTFGGYTTSGSFPSCYKINISMEEE